MGNARRAGLGADYRAAKTAAGPPAIIVLGCARSSDVEVHDAIYLEVPRLSTRSVLGSCLAPAVAAVSLCYGFGDHAIAILPSYDDRHNPNRDLVSECPRNFQTLRRWLLCGAKDSRLNPPSPYRAQVVVSPMWRHQVYSKPHPEVCVRPPPADPPAPDAWRRLVLIRCRASGLLALDLSRQLRGVARKTSATIVRRGPMTFSIIVPNTEDGLSEDPLAQHDGDAGRAPGALGHECRPLRFCLSDPSSMPIASSICGGELAAVLA